MAEEMLTLLIVLSAVALRTLAVAPQGPWDQFNFAPQNRISRPRSIHSTQGVVDNANSLLSFPSGTASLNETGSFVVVDFGQEVAVLYRKERCLVC